MFYVTKERPLKLTWFHAKLSLSLIHTFSLKGNEVSHLKLKLTKYTQF